MKIVFMGNNDFSLEVFKKIYQKHEIVLVCMNPDKIQGRKKEIVFSPVKMFCLENNLEFFQPSKLKEDYSKITEKEFDFIVTASFGQFIPKFLTDNYKIINVHGSLLPSYRGGAPIYKAILDNNKYAGISIMKTVAKMDAGPYYIQDKILIDILDNKTTLEKKLSILGANLLLKYLDNPNLYLETIQDEDKVSFAYFPKEIDTFIDFEKDQISVYNQIRALNYEPGAFCYAENVLYKIIDCRVSDIILSGKPGQIFIQNKKMYVLTATLPIEILTIQQQGKKVLNIKDFLNGKNLNNLFFRRYKNEKTS